MIMAELLPLKENPFTFKFIDKIFHTVTSIYSGELFCLMTVLDLLRECPG